jgi:hypothetical protein
MHMTTKPSVSTETIECPLCLGEGELTRAEVLDRLGVKDFARVAQLSAEEAFRLLLQKQEHTVQNDWARFEAELAKRTADIAQRHKDELHALTTRTKELEGAARAAEQQKAHEIQHVNRRVEDFLREVAKKSRLEVQSLWGNPQSGNTLSGLQDGNYCADRIWVRILSELFPEWRSLEVKCSNQLFFDQPHLVAQVTCPVTAALLIEDEPALSQQLSHNAEPFRIQWFPTNRLPRPTVPISCVALIAFLAMQVGVHPRTLGAFVLLSRFVSLSPIALGIPPQPGEGEREFRRWFGCGQ